MKKGAGIIFRAMVFVLIGVAIGVYISDNDSSSHSFHFGNSSKVTKALKLIRENYVDSVDEDSLEGIAVNNLLQNLDPHSLYLQPQRAESINENLDGGFTGVGLEYQLLRDTLVVTQVYTGSPAAGAGLSTGDRILSVNKKDVSGRKLTAELVDKAFKGDTNSGVSLALIPFGSNAVKKVFVKRGHVDLSSLDAAYMVAPGVGYIKISKFAATTDDDFRSALEKLKGQELSKLVLDIRDNGGGYLTAATSLADEFLKKGSLIVYTKGTHEERKDYFASDSGAFKNGKLAVLIDEYSASASEILAGALQDLDRAVIVGRRSFGKGLVQEQFPFGDGSAINLTVARYYTPSGRSIQKSYKGGTDDYHNEIMERMRKGELFSAQNSYADSLVKRPTPFHTKSGRKVFSGGGIMPDIFVPADSNQNTQLIEELGDQQLFNAYVIDRMQPALDRFSKVEDFVKQYPITDNQFNDFIMYASKTIKEMDSHEILISRPEIERLIKAYAARFKWGDNGYFEALNNDDPTLRKAIEAIN